MAFNKQGKKDNDDKKKRRRMTKIQINELSAVDRPAMEPALATIMKRAPVTKRAVSDLVSTYLAEDNVEYSVEIYGDYVYITAMDGDGARFTVSRYGDGDYSVTATEYSRSLGEEDIAGLDAAIEVAMSNAMNNLSKSVPDNLPQPFCNISIYKTAVEDSNNQPEGDMPDKDSAVTKALQTENTSLKSQLAKALALAGMTDIAKAHYQSLDDSGKEMFIGKSALEQNAELELAKAADPVEYTTADGLELRKSAGTLMIKMAKDNDELKKQNAEGIAKAAQAEFEKRADAEIGHMAGTVEVRAALLKSVSTIEDEEVRKGALEALAGADKQMAKGFKESGRTFVKGLDEQGESAADKLDALAKAKSEKEGTSFHKAYRDITQTPEGVALMGEMRKEAK